MRPQTLFQYLCLIGLWLFASAAAAVSPVLLPHDSFQYSITPYLSIYEDSSKELTIDEITSLEHLLLFSPTHAKKIKLGTSDSNFWFRFSVTNPYNKPLKAVFSLSDSDYDLINFYHLMSDNNYRYFPDEHHSRQLPGSLFQKHSLQIKIPANSTNTYLLQTHSRGLIAAMAKLQTIDKFLLNEQKLLLILGVSIGLFLAVSIFSIYVILFYRLPIASIALALTILYVFMQLAAFGYLELITDVSSITADKASEFTLGLTGFLQFSTLLTLHWPKQSKNTPTVATAIAALIIPATIMTIIFTPVAALPIISILVATTNLLAILILFFNKSKSILSQYFLRFSHTISLVGILVALLTSLNFLNFDDFAAWVFIIVPIGIMFLITAAMIAQIIQYNSRYKTQATNEAFLQHVLSDQVSKDLRAPAHDVISICDSLKDTPLNSSQRALNNSLFESGHKLLHSINQIRDIGYIYSGDIQFKNEPVNIIELVNTILCELQAEANRRNVEFILDFSEDLPHYIQTDPSRLHSVIYNILQRALSYSEFGEISVSLSVLDAKKGFDVLIGIQLSSTVIKPEQLRSSFSVLQHQYDLPAKNNHEWHLLLTRLLIKKLNARLEVESMTLQGASLSLFLSFPNEPIPTRQDTQSNLLHGRRIMIVDDNATLRSTLEKHIKRWGLDVSSTYSSKEALTLIKNEAHADQPYDFLIIDQGIPLIEGVELSMLIQEDTKITTKPAIVLLTSGSVSDIREDAYNTGVAIVLAKPVYPEHLQQALQDLLPDLQPR